MTKFADLFPMQKLFECCHLNLNVDLFCTYVESKS